MQTRRGRCKISGEYVDISNGFVEGCEHYRKCVEKKGSCYLEVEERKDMRVIERGKRLGPLG